MAESPVQADRRAPIKSHNNPQFRYGQQDDQQAEDIDEDPTLGSARTSAEMSAVDEVAGPMTEEQRLKNHARLKGLGAASAKMGDLRLHVETKRVADLTKQPNAWS
ncbi:MAG: hypothetical protein WDW36_002910 [Sanguina aurantia]